MKKILTTILTIGLTVLLFSGAAAGFFLYKKFSPSQTLADQEKWFGASGDQVAVILDNELAEGVQGRLVDGSVYLPLTWVNTRLNEKFYWDKAEKLLIYTLPESIVYANKKTLGNGGKPLLVEQEDQVWLLAGLVASYTDVRLAQYTDEEVKRIFVDTSWESFPTASIKKAGKLRVRGGIKSEILTEVNPGDTVDVLEALENWTKVRTENGYIGYIQNKLLGEPEECTPVSTFAAPVYTNISLDERISLVWHQVTSQEANQKLDQLMANTKGVNVVAPTWFMLTDNQGNFDSLASQSYVDKVHSLGAQVWAVVDNFNRGQNVRSEILFASTQARKDLIAGLMAEVEKYGIDGLNLDIESIKSEAGPHYVQFIRELSVDCRKQGIVLSVDTYVPSAYTAFYNRAEMGRVADYVIMMGYDEHYAGGEAGSVASLDYERQGIQELLGMVPAEKVISAIPFYTRLWLEGKNGETTSTAMGIANAKKWVEENQMELSWSEELGQYYGEKATEDGTYYLWMEEEQSIEKKVQLIQKFDLAGVACWKLGFEPAELWDIVNP